MAEKARKRDRERKEEGKKDKRHKKKKVKSHKRKDKRSERDADKRLKAAAAPRAHPSSPSSSSLSEASSESSRERPPRAAAVTRPNPLPPAPDAAAAAHVLIELVRARPDGASDLAELLKLVDGGESIVIDGIADLFVRTALEALFVAAGLRASAGEGSDGAAERSYSALRGHSLPLGPVLASVMPATAGASAERPGGGECDGVAAGVGEAASDVAGPQLPPSSPTPSSPTAATGLDEHEHAAVGSSARTLGPARPPAELLARAEEMADSERLALAMADMPEAEGAADERAPSSPGSPLVGPALPPGASADEVGGDGAGASGMALPAKPQWWQRTAAEVAAAVLARSATAEPVREEWMTALPTNRQGPSFAVDAARGFTRQGLTELGDTSVWTDTPEERRRKAAARFATIVPGGIGVGSERQGVGMLSGVSLAARQVAEPAAAPPRAAAQPRAAGVAPPPTSSGPKTLVEMHLERQRQLAAPAHATGGKGGKSGKGAKAGKGGRGQPLDWDPESAPWRPFDRDKDLDPRRADPNGLKRALNDHVMGTLSSRFGTKGKCESSFM